VLLVIPHPYPLKKQKSGRKQINKWIFSKNYRQIIYTEKVNIWPHLIKQCTIGTQRPISKSFNTTNINPFAQGMANFVNQILRRKKM